MLMRLLIYLFTVSFFTLRCFFRCSLIRRAHHFMCVWFFLRIRFIEIIYFNVYLFGGCHNATTHSIPWQTIKYNQKYYEYFFLLILIFVVAIFLFHSLDIFFIQTRLTMKCILLCARLAVAVWVRARGVIFQLQ